jgi:hypothetical protein
MRRVEIIGPVIEQRHEARPGARPAMVNANRSTETPRAGRRRGTETLVLKGPRIDQERRDALRSSLKMGHVLLPMGGIGDVASADASRM